MGIGWSVLRELNPRLIYATASGYGISGPNRSDLAMDLTVQAASGIMSVTGFADGPPVRTGVTVADFMGGIHVYAAIMTALFEREHSGIGRLVEVAMQEAVYFTLAGPMEQHRRRGAVPAPQRQWRLRVVRRRHTACSKCEGRLTSRSIPARISIGSTSWKAAGRTRIMIDDPRAANDAWS